MNEASPWATELSHAWPILVADGGEVASCPLPLEVGGRSIRVAVDGVGSRHLLIPLQHGEQPPSDDRDGVLRLGVRTLPAGSVQMRFRSLTCHDADLFDVFDDLLADVLLAVEADPALAIVSTDGVVARWRALFRLRSGRSLSVVAQLGLFAELHVLLLVSGDPVPVASWRGPLREPHDIRTGRVAVEVKAVGASSSSVEIHGVRQLDPPPGSPLALVVVRLEEEDRGSSLPEIAQRLMDRADDRGKARDLLGRAGYAATDAYRYTSRWAATETRFVEVGDGVPRVVDSSFATGAPAAGVERLTYSIELARLLPLTTLGENALVEWVGK